MRSTLKLPSWVSIRSEKLQGMIMENEVANAAKDKSEWLWDAMIDWLLERWWWWNCAGFKCIYCESVPSIRFPQWVFVCARYNSAMMYYWIEIPNIKSLLADKALTYILRVWPKKKKLCIYECRKFVRQHSPSQKIIVYFRSIINAHSLFSH